MKKLATISLLAASALILAPKPAVAGNSELAAIGGFIGGLIIGSNVNSQPYCPPVYYPAAPVVVYENGGYWRTSSVRVWVTPRWLVTCDRYNRPLRRYIAGHYESRNHRNWVAHNRSHRDYIGPSRHNRHHQRNDRSYRRHDRDNRRTSSNHDRSNRRRNRH